MTDRFDDPHAFRASLEQRILNTHRASGTPIDRLRKDVGFQRLVARFLAIDDDRWAIKGGAALLWRIALDVRATRDVDASWRGGPDDLGAFLDRAADHDLGDWFAFDLGPPRPLRGEADGALRFRLVVRLAGREFTRFHLDVNLTRDARPVERVTIHVEMLAFVGLADLEVPMVTVAQQLSEKLHAVTRRYASGGSSRAKDAYDSLIYAQTGSLPTAGELRHAVEQTFAIRETPVPAQAPELPTAWIPELAALLGGYPVPGISDPEALAAAWRRLWSPVLDGTADSGATWNVEAQAWTPASLVEQSW